MFTGNLQDKSRLKPSCLYLFFFLLTRPLMAFVILMLVRVFDETINYGVADRTALINSSSFFPVSFVKALKQSAKGITFYSCVFRLSHFFSSSLWFLFVKFTFLFSFFVIHSQLSYFFYILDDFLCYKKFPHSTQLFSSLTECFSKHQREQHNEKKCCDDDG